MQDWLTADVAAHARCSGATVTRAVQAGKLRVKRNGKPMHFDPAEAKRWARERRERRERRK
jgi:hypothetical protein